MSILPNIVSAKFFSTDDNARVFNNPSATKAKNKYSQHLVSWLGKNEQAAGVYNSVNEDGARVFNNARAAKAKNIAITIDDLPFVGESQNFHLNMIIEALKTNAVPATGFIIASEVTPKNWEMLQKFRESGFGLGNHTLSHANLNRMDTDAYIKEIDSADKILSPILTKPKFFRYPYLIMGKGVKKEKIIKHLFEKNYQIAPISIDSKDFMFNQLLLSVPENERRNFLKLLKPCYLNFIWQQTLKAEEHSNYLKKPEQPQILLIHANLLNAYVLPDIINLFRDNGFNFVSLEETLKTNDEVPKPLPTLPVNDIANSEDGNLVAWD